MVYPPMSCGKFLAFGLFFWFNIYMGVEIPLGKGSTQSLNPSGERFGGCRLFSEVGPWNKYGNPCQRGFTSIRANIEMNMYSILLNSTIYFLGLKTIEKSLPKGFCVLVPHGFQQ